MQQTMRPVSSENREGAGLVKKSEWGAGSRKTRQQGRRHEKRQQGPGDGKTDSKDNTRPDNKAQTTREQIIGHREI